MGLEKPLAVSACLAVFAAGLLHAAPKLRLGSATVGPVSVAVGGNAPSQTVHAYNAGDGSLALAGDALVIYCLGVGATNPPVTADAAAPSSEPLARVPDITRVNFGGGFTNNQVSVTPLFAGLTPGFVGLYQVNVVVPDDAPAGPAVNLTVTVGGVESNVVQIATQ